MPTESDTVILQRPQNGDDAGNAPRDGPEDAGSIGDKSGKMPEKRKMTTSFLPLATKSVAWFETACCAGLLTMRGVMGWPSRRS